MDAKVQYEGTLVIFHLETNEAEDWWEENCEDGQQWCGGYVVGHRMADAIWDAMEDAGLEVGYV